MQNLPQNVLRVIDRYGFPGLLLSRFIAALVLSLLFYGRAVTAFPTFDELSLLRMVAHPGAEWLDCLRPFTNGFWRPLPLIVVRSVYVVFGQNSIVLHLVSILLLASVATLTGTLAGRLLPGRPSARWLATLLVVIHPGMFDVGLTPSAYFDGFLSCGLLLLLLGWLPQAATKTISSRRMLMMVSGTAVAVLSKESAFIAPLLILAWVPYTGWQGQRGKYVLAALTLLAVAQVTVSFYLLKTASTSYMNMGNASLRPVSLFRSYADHAVSLVIPFLHALPAPLVPLVASHQTLWAIRVGLAVSTLLLLVLLIRTRKPGGPGLSLFCTILVAVLPAACYSGPVQVRLLSIGAPAVVLTAVWIILAGPPAWRTAAKTAAAVLGTWYIAGLLFSPTLKAYLRTAEQVKTCVEEMKRLAPSWPDPAVVTILNHPHPGKEPWRWVYIQHLSFLFLPEHSITVYASPHPDSDRSYRFDGNRLRELADF